MKSLISFWNRHFLLDELLSTILVSGIVALWYQRFDGHLYINALLAKNRPEIYGTFASITSSLLGFILASMSMAIVFLNTKALKIVRESKHHLVLWKVFTNATWAFAFATLMSLILLIFDRNDSPNPILLLIFFFAVMLAILRMVRVIWVLNWVIIIVAANADSEDP